MPILSDCHLHSLHSGDSEAPMLAQAEAAAAAGLKTMCFTEHLDHNYRYDLNPEADCSFDLDMEAYRRDFLGLRAHAPAGLEILFGVELGLMPDLDGYYTDFLSRNRDLDYVIGSVHLINGYDPYYSTIFDGHDEKEIHRSYFECMLSCVKACGCFDSLGHLDYVVRYGPSGGKNYRSADYMEIIDEILRIIIRRDQALEINTKPLYKGMLQPNPDPAILTRYRELGGRLLTVGSDAHFPEGIGFGFDRVLSLVRESGFSSIAVYRNRIPEEYGI